MERKKSQSSQHNIEKARGQTLSNFEKYYKTTVIKTVWYWSKNRQVEQ